MMTTRMTLLVQYFNPINYMMSLLVVVSFSPKHRVHGACFLSQSDVVSTIVAAVINLARVETHCYRDIQKKITLFPLPLPLSSSVAIPSVFPSPPPPSSPSPSSSSSPVARRPLTFDRSLPLLLPLSSSLPSSFLRHCHFRRRRGRPHCWLLSSSSSSPGPLNHLCPSCCCFVPVESD